MCGSRKFCQRGAGPTLTFWGGEGLVEEVISK